MAYLQFVGREEHEEEGVPTVCEIQTVGRSTVGVRTCLTEVSCSITVKFQLSFCTSLENAI